MRGIILASIFPLICVGCGPYSLGGVNTLPPGKTAQDLKLDMLVCQHQAQLEVDRPANQVADFLLGFTLIGAPVAIVTDRQMQRQSWQTCMTEAGYTVVPPQ